MNKAAFKLYFWRNTYYVVENKTSFIRVDVKECITRDITRFIYDPKNVELYSILTKGEELRRNVSIYWIEDMAEWNGTYMEPRLYLLYLKNKNTEKYADTLAFITHMLYFHDFEKLQKVDAFIKDIGSTFK